ncbi:fructose-1,6-bisphosphatase class 1 [Ignatzschineria indica]|uniref:Fructose-1,6-bisphosphatase class 1 n=1 Tax=Ignatzschineria indica TaxID=472583 RepID=A0A2U2APX0_9GAMM|nr:class 1 fructose-bisphosphatase [Ignatzschineria indica]PWD85566.1 class 1 fructose-bisphosphatase [Ignatzschineria indica]GGZ88389.1 fructose-1,6-bisphosphatase class 1 [Ignatzschineria indica]
MTHFGVTLSQFIMEEQRRFPEATGNFTLLLNDIAVSCKMIAAAVQKGQLANVLGATDNENCQGETQQILDVIANELFIKNNANRGHVAAMASEEMDDVFNIPENVPRGNYLLIFDPLDGSSNIDINGPIGTIFSILKTDKKNPTEEDFLQEGTKQVCAGYCLYGSATMMVLTIGYGTHGFTLDPAIGEFILTHPNMQIPSSTAEYAINQANRNLWEPPMRKYIDECDLGVEGPRKKKFTMRWVGAMVMDIHRLIQRGGLFAYPMDSSLTEKGGRLRLMYEANPMAFLVEQAGGIASTGYERILDLAPEKLHQRVPVIMGSTDEMKIILDNHKVFAKEAGKEFTHQCKNYA